MKIPTLDEMLNYQSKNPELSGINIPYLYDRYEKTAKMEKGQKVWVDRNNQRVNNWKAKLFTLARYYPPKPIQCQCRSAACVFCHTEGCRSYFISPQGQIIQTCDDCNKALRRMGVKSYDRPLSELEILRDKGKQLLNSNRAEKEKLLSSTGSDSMDEYKAKEKVREQITKLAMKMGS